MTYKQLLRVLVRTDMLIFAGGTLLADDRPDSHLRGHPLRLLLLVFMCKLARTKVAFLGVGAEPVSRRHKRSFLHLALMFSTLVVARNLDSQQVIGQQYRNVRCELGADLFLFTSSASNHTSPEQITYALRREELEYAIPNGLIAADSRVILMDPTDLPPHLRSALSDCELVEPRGWRDAFACLSDSRVVVASRMHALYFAAVAGRPYCAVSSSNKVRTFCEEFGGTPLTLSSISSFDAVVASASNARSQAVELARARLERSLAQVVVEMQGNGAGLS